MTILLIVVTRSVAQIPFSEEDEEKMPLTGFIRRPIKYDVLNSVLPGPLFSQKDANLEFGIYPKSGKFKLVVIVLSVQNVLEYRYLVA